MNKADIVRWLNSPDPRVRLDGIRMCLRRRYRDPAVQARIANLVSDSDHFVKAVALLAVKGLRISGARSEVVACLDDPFPSIRSLALDVLELVYPLELAFVLPVIRNLTADPDDDVRLKASRLLTQLAPQ